MQYESRSAVIFGFATVILVPYLSRLLHGLDWALQYVPANFMANAFFIGFASIPGAVLWLALRIWPRKWELPFITALASMSMALGFLHHDFDLAADPQAAIELIIIPIKVSLMGLAAYVGVMVLRSAFCGDKRAN